MISVVDETNSNHFVFAVNENIVTLKNIVKITKTNAFVVTSDSSDRHDIFCFEPRD